MSVIRLGDLLDQVQREAWDLAYELPEAHAATLRAARRTAERIVNRSRPRGLGYEQTGWELRRQEVRESIPLPTGAERTRLAGRLAHAQLAAWPRLADAARRALTAIPLVPRPEDARPLLSVQFYLDRLRCRHVEGDPDVRLTRMAVLLGAIADMLAHQPVATSGDIDDAVRARDRLLAMIDTAARWSSTTLAVGVHVQHDGRETLSNGLSVTGWRLDLLRVADYAHRALAHVPGDRAGALDDIAVVTGDDPTLAGTLARWQSATRLALDIDAAAASSRGVQATAVDLRVVAMCCGRVSQIAGELGLTPPALAEVAAAACSSASLAWRHAASAWAPVRSGGAMSHGQILPGRELGERLAELLRGGSGWAPAQVVARRVDVLELMSTMRRLMTDAERLGNQYARTVSEMIIAQTLVLPARIAARSERPVRVETMQAAQRGHWVRLHPTLAEARILLVTAGTAATTTSSARVEFAATARGTVTEGRAEAPRRRQPSRSPRCRTAPDGRPADDR